MFCFYCESGNVPKNLEKKGFIWIHLDCFMKLNNFKNDLTSVKEILEGMGSNETIESFINRMQEFDKKWDNTTKILKEKGLI